MNFPVGTFNGQTTTVNGIVYIYDSTKTAWKRSTSFAGNLTILGNITSANVITGNVYTSGGIYWSNNGAAYSSGGGGGGSSNFLYTASASAPGSPTKGDQWFDTTDGTLYEYIDDGDSLQWVDIQTPTFASNAITTLLSGDVSTDGNISASSIVITSGIYWANGVAFVSSVYSNVNVEAYIGANIGSYQTYANANIGTLFLGNVSTQANLGTLFLGNVSTQANLGAFQTFSNANAATQATAINTINANLGAYQLYANANVVAFNSYANTKIGTNNNSNLVIDATTTSTSMTTGALVVRGGVGIAGNVYANGNVFLGGGVNSNLVANATTTSTSTTTGALVVRGGAGIAGNVYADRLYTTNGLYWSGNGVSFSSGSGSPFASNIVAASGTTSTNITTGALVIAGSGGLGVGGTAYIQNLYVNQDMYVEGGFLQARSGYTATSTTSGAIIIPNNGGLGVTGNAYIGNEFVVPGGGKITATGLAYLLEKVTVSATAPSGNVNVDMATQSVLYWTGNATANVSANIRGTATQPLNSLLATGQSVTAVLFLPNGASNFLVSNVRIDNTTVPVAYQGNAAPVLGNSNSIDIYSFTILKTASATYKIFASQTQFMHPG